MDTDPLLLFRRAPKGLDRSRLRAFAETLRTRVANGHSFCAMLTGDDDVRDLNRYFLDKDEPTDVLSFPARDPSESLGDIAISWQRARAQAAGRGHSIEDEIEILMLHGLLHRQLGEGWTDLLHVADESETARPTNLVLQLVDQS